MRIFRFSIAAVLPWLLLELGLRIAGYHAPDSRRRLALFPKFPAFYEPDRDLGWVLKPNVTWTEPDFVVGFRTDAAGHRTTTPDDSSSAQAGAAQVDCIGDSSTFGYGARDEETYPSALARILNHSARPSTASGSAPGSSAVRVRNLGVPGYQSLSARTLAEKNFHHAPVSLVMVGFNDHFPATRTAAEELRIRRYAYTCFMSRICSTLFHWTTRDPAGPPPATPSYQPTVSPAEFRENLTEAVHSLRARQSEPILIVYPSILSDEETRAGVAAYWRQPRDQVDANIDAHPLYQQITREVALREHAPLVDLVPVFDAHGNAALHLDWVHPNPEGYSWIARTVAPVVQAALAFRGS